MYRVLLALDGDEDRARAAADAVAALPCSETDIDVTILNVFEHFEVGDETIASSEDVYDETDVPESVTIAADALAEADIDATIRREHGDPAPSITTIAEEIDADCIAMCGRKRSPTGKVLFGSVTQAVLLSADQPVHVVVED